MAGRFMGLDLAARRNLELTQTMRSKENARFRSLVSGVLREFMLDSRNRGVTVFADSNPDL